MSPKEPTETDASEPSDAELNALIRGAGLRATRARASVLRCLLRAVAPVTHADVCEQLESLGYDRVTLYRNLTDLAEAGLATRTDLGDHLWRFEAKGREHLHPHFVCTDCGEVSCLPEDIVNVKPRRGIPRALSRKQVEIQLRGRCNACD